MRLRTAFVFSGGGSLGAVEVGMLRELLRRGERADLVVGASVGALNAAYFAGRPTLEGVAELEAIWRGLDRRHIFPVAVGSVLRAALGRRPNLVSPRSLAALLERHLPFARLEEAALPCHVVAADLQSGEPVTLSRGPATLALLASAAIPAVFPPVRIQGRFLVDGGVAANTPIAAALALGAERVIVIPTGYACALAAPPRSVLGMALHALGLLITRQLLEDLRHLAGQARMHVCPPPCPVRAEPHEFSDAGALIERAAGETRRWIDAGGLDGPLDPRPLEPHRHEMTAG